MNNIKKCSISGVAFTLDEEAYKTLEAYFDSLRASYGETADGKEIVADIEARIAELILSTQEGDRVVQKPLIDNIIAQMGSARDISEESSEEGSAGESSPKEPRIPRRLYRDTANAKLGGVCAGIGKYFDIDPVWVRLAMFLPLIFTCMGGHPLPRMDVPDFRQPLRHLHHLLPDYVVRRAGGTHGPSEAGDER